MVAACTWKGWMQRVQDRLHWRRWAKEYFEEGRETAPWKKKVKIREKMPKTWSYQDAYTSASYLIPKSSSTATCNSTSIWSASPGPSSFGWPFKFAAFSPALGFTCGATGLAGILATSSFPSGLALCPKSTSSCSCPSPAPPSCRCSLCPRKHQNIRSGGRGVVGDLALPFYIWNPYYLMDKYEFMSNTRNAFLLSFISFSTVPMES